MSKTISQTHNEEAAEPNPINDETIDRIKPAHENNITHGSEFLDDAIRTKDQPFNSWIIAENNKLNKLK